MVYCPHCTMPPEFCEHGPCFDRCLPWLRDNFPQYLSTEHLERSMAAASLAGGEAGEVTIFIVTIHVCLSIFQKGEAVATEPPKKQKNSKKAAAPPEIKVVVAKIQRQKRKFITAIAGLETVPDLRLKDATKVLGKKFSSGASVNETPSGAKEVVIQGDFLFDVPELLVNQFKVVPATAIFIMEDKTLRPYA
ncbi:unnamed protein product [Ectocarpus fasciculatus]